MQHDDWKLNVFQSGARTYAVIACNYASGLVEMFKIDAEGCWHHLGGKEPLDDVRLFYAVHSMRLPPAIRASLRAYLGSDQFETLVDTSLKVCIRPDCQEMGCAG